MRERQYIGARYVPVFATPVEWDNVRAYEALTIVTHLGNSYTSKVPVPAGVDIGDTKYWVNTGNFNAQLNNINEQLNNIDGKFKDIDDAISGGVKHCNELVKYVYIDGVNGNDNNDGSVNAPFKTLDKFFNLANSIPGCLDIRCNIVSPGVYDITWETLNNVSTHIVGSVNGVILRSTSDKYFTIYGGHTNIKNVTITSNVSMKFESVTTMLDNVTLNRPVEQFGGTLILEACSVPSCLLSYGCTILRNGITLTNNDPSVRPIDCNCHTLYLYGTVTFTPLDVKTKTNICYLRRTNASLAASITNNDNTNYSGIFVYNSHILSSKDILQKYETVSDATTFESVCPVYTQEGVAINSIPE